MAVFDTPTPVQVPTAAPPAVRAAAVALSVAIEDLTDSHSHSHTTADLDRLREADMVCTIHRGVIEMAGWRFTGIVNLDDGRKGWKVEAA